MWISTVVSICISTMWVSTVISTCISTKYKCTYIYSNVSMESISTVSLRRYLYYHTYTSETRNPYIQIYPSLCGYLYFHTFTHKPEISKSRISSRSLLQPYMKYLHKLIAYYIIGHKHYNRINNIREQVVGYIMSMKKKRRSNLKARNPKQDKYHLMFNNVLPSDSDLICTNTHKRCCLLNVNEYNYKLRSVIG